MQEHEGNAQPRGALFRKAALRAALGNISERKFDDLRAAGIIPDPIELGPRVSCWTQQDYETILARLPRRVKAPEPETLATARRARIEAIDRKQWATAQARAALAGFSANLIEADDGSAQIIVSRWALARSFASVDELLAWLPRVESTSAAR